MRRRNPKFEWQSEFIRSGTTGNSGFIGLLMSTYDNGDGEGFYISQDSISEMTGLNVKTVRTNINALIEAGWIIKTRQGRSRGGQGRASEYELAVPKAQPATSGSQPGNDGSQPASVTRPLDPSSLDPSPVDLSTLRPGEEITQDRYEGLGSEDKRLFCPSFSEDATWVYSPPTQVGTRADDTRSPAQQQRSQEYALREEGLDRYGEPLTYEPTRRGRSRVGGHV